MARLGKRAAKVQVRPFSARLAINHLAAIMPLYLTRDADASVLAEYLTRNHAELAPLLSQCKKRWAGLRGASHESGHALGRSLPTQQRLESCKF